MSGQLSEQNFFKITIREVPNNIFLEYVKRQYKNICLILSAALLHYMFSSWLCEKNDEMKTTNSESPIISVDDFNKYVKDFPLDVKNIDISQEKLAEVAEIFSEHSTTSIWSSSSKIIIKDKHQIHSLQARLHYILKQNTKLYKLVTYLESKLKKKEASLNENRPIMQMASVQTDGPPFDDGIIVSEKKLFEVQNLFQTRIREIKLDFRDNIRDLTNNYNISLQQKDKEIKRLEEIVQSQSERLVGEITTLRDQIDIFVTCNNTDERISFLQKCVSKMDKLYKKAEREFVKNVQKLKKDLEQQEKANQIQLQTQRAEIIAEYTLDKQNELDEAIRKLEERYTKLLHLQETENLIVLTKNALQVVKSKQLLNACEITSLNKISY